MSRIININNPGRVRSQNKRTVAEIIRRVGSKPQIDPEAKDMAASLVYLLREIFESANHTATAWEKRGYWMKADRLLREWEWSAEMASNIEDVIRNEAWDLLPRLIAELIPFTADVNIKSMTRPASLWQGAYHKLLAEPPGEMPW